MSSLPGQCSIYTTRNRPDILPSVCLMPWRLERGVFSHCRSAMLLEGKYYRIVNSPQRLFAGPQAHPPCLHYSNMEGLSIASISIGIWRACRMGVHMKVVGSRKLWTINAIAFAFVIQSDLGTHSCGQ